MSVTDLPTVNASLNGIATVLLVCGFLAIRAGRWRVHRGFMLSAFGCSVLFLISYLIYHAQVGSVPFQGTGVLRVVYFAILIPHVVLAALVPFLALYTLRLGLLREDGRHRRIARWTLPIWLFVSVTGVMVYGMLYHLPVA